LGKRIIGWQLAAQFRHLNLDRAAAVGAVYHMVLFVSLLGLG
jgi:hypothetical protein